MNAQQLCPKQPKEIPLLLDVSSIPVVNSNSTLVWNNYIYYLEKMEYPNPISIVEASITDGNIIRRIPINCMPTHMALNNYHRRLHIFRSEDYIGIINEDNRQIYVKQLNTYEESIVVSPELVVIKRITSIITHENKLYVAVLSNIPQMFENNYEYDRLSRTSSYVIIIDFPNYNMVDKIPAMNDTIYTLDVINDYLIICQNWFGPRKIIYDTNDLDIKPIILDNQCAKLYAKYNNTIYPYHYNSYLNCTHIFPVADEYTIIDTTNSPMNKLQIVDIINDRFYIGLQQSDTGSGHKITLNMYNSQTHQLLGSMSHPGVFWSPIIQDRNYHISGEHIIFKTRDAIEIYKIELREIYTKQVWNNIITNLADDYSLAKHLEQEIRKNFWKELEGYTPFEIIHT